ncbi:MAG: BON domain-containing protein, partial [Proteobacteria bacterium]|nr:BON domain-containing protein [Pseudomonadota bacterium]
MFDSLEKADSRLQKDVREELKMDPSINSDQIKVTCDGGIVTLRGTVPHFFEKGTAEKSALH